MTYATPELPDSGPTRLHPAWREAMRQLTQAQRLVPGEVLTRAELVHMFALREPQTIAQYEEHRLRFLREFSDLREALLQDEQLMLRPIAGIGWAIIPPQDQTDRAMDDRMREVHRALGKLGAELVNIRTEALTDDQRAANSNALAKVGQIAAMMGRNSLTHRSALRPMLPTDPGSADPADPDAP